MEQSTESPELELLAQIHNRIVELTRLIAEVEMQKTNSEMMKTKLRLVISTAKTIDAAHPGVVTSRQQKVIAPTNTSITPGEDYGK